MMLGPSCIVNQNTMIDINHLNSTVHNANAIILVKQVSEHILD